MASFGQGSRVHPRSRGRTWSRTGPDRATLAVVGVVCAVLAALWLIGAATPGYGMF